MAGVTADVRTIKYWKSIGVKDSKLVTAKKREKLSEVIKETAIRYIIREITPETIDDKTFNLNEWEIIRVLELAGELLDFTEISLQSIKCLYIDNWEISEKRFNERFNSLDDEIVLSKMNGKGVCLKMGLLKQIKIVPKHQADEKYIVVGAASILAKTSSDEQLRIYREQYGDFGSGNPGDPKTRRFIWDNKNNNDVPIIRRSWQTYMNIVNLVDFSLDSFKKNTKTKRKYTKKPSK
ncbi:MAG: hypothetical protein M1475_01720 [Actinobacteria bacterium]|nr:hypothetical protein [Actinomycetota bacterium]